ncbi:MAG TPA: hypothetical protein VLH86_01685 [Patescibacteria group bacterium]|nr:hypothetical protein [Patescibacteria group bacterium]
MPFKRKTRTKKAPFYTQPLFIALAALLVTAGVVTALELTGVINIFKNKHPGLATQPTTPNRTSGPNTKGEQPATTPAANPNTSENDTKLPAADPNAKLIDPSGSFVSNHHPTLSGTPGPAMQSACVTTSGATCTIIFTKGSEVKQLPVQTTDREGAAYWTWDVQKLGLSAGTWKVQAKAELGTQSKTADDALDLEIKP